MARLRDELDEVTRQARAAVEHTHRQYRRDLVPMNQSVVLWEGARRPLR